MKITGVTMQLDVSDITRSRGFYDELFGREPEIIVDDDTQEYEVHPGFWLQLARTDDPTATSRLRLGTDDIEAARAEIAGRGVEVTPIDTVPEVVAWCDFTDPDGHPLGLYQDLS
jgi:glyoxylase I family protein